MSAYPIDIVIPWVDGDDPAWRAERAQYRPTSRVDNSDARFREWGLFQYWFRSIELYAPWVRTVHLVTWGHLPPWLNTNHPKLHIVNHKDYIPAEYLPTFSSHAIELNMHRIPGLAEHFIYFNDDVYLNHPTRPEDFFVNGLPVDTAVMGQVTNSDTFSFLPYIQLNMLGCINQTFPKREILRRHKAKWFSPQYGKLLLNNLYLIPGKNWSGIRNFHTCVPFCKTTLEEVWVAFPQELDRACRNRFRSREDVNQYLFRYWRLMKGEFFPTRPNSRYLTLGVDSAGDIERALSSVSYKVVCVNDDPMDGDPAQEQRKMSEIFRQKFPQPSEFETTNTEAVNGEANHSI